MASITPAFPKIIDSFQISARSVGLLITVFTLPGVILTPVLGVLADRFGRKKILIPSLLLFAFAGAACGFAPDFNTLLILRIFQGVGSAALGSINVTLIGDLFKDRDRAAAMGYNASVLSVGTASYPAIGGALALLGWRYPFFIPIIALPLAIFVMLFLQNPEPQNTQGLREYLGNTLRYISKREVIMLFIISIVTFVILYGSYLTYFPILISGRFQGNTLVIGLLMSCGSISTAITSANLGRLNEYYSPRFLISSGFVLYIIAMMLIPFIPGIWYMLVPIIVFGIAQGFNIPSVQTLLAGMAPIEHRAAFMSVNGMVLRLGQTLGPILIGLFYAFGGIDWAYYSGALLALLMLITIFIYLNPAGSVNKN